MNDHQIALPNNLVTPMNNPAIAVTGSTEIQYNTPPPSIQGTGRQISIVADDWKMYILNRLDFKKSHKWKNQLPSASFGNFTVRYFQLTSD